MSYECRVCGYEPTEREAQSGSCPDCFSARQAEREILPRKLDALPVGSSFQVFDNWGAPQGQTQALWEKIGPDQWRSREGYNVTFTDEHGDEQVIWYVKGMTQRFDFKGPVFSTKSIYGRYSLETCYRATYAIHDVTPTHSSVVHQRFHDYYSNLGCAA